MTKREILDAVEAMRKHLQCSGDAASAVLAPTIACLSRLAEQIAEDVIPGELAHLHPSAPPYFGLWSGSGWLRCLDGHGIFYLSPAPLFALLIGDRQPEWVVARIPDDGGPPAPDDVIPWPETGTPDR